jgi:hypothetical protein
MPKHGDGDVDAVVEGLRGTLERTDHGRKPRSLQLSGALDELDAWLADDKQWLHGAPQQWKTLVEDVIDRARLLASLADGTVQTQLRGLADQLRRLQSQFGGAAGDSDAAHRRELSRTATALRKQATNAELLLSAWGRIGQWSVKHPGKAEDGVAALHDLLGLHGYDATAHLQGVDRLLSDVGWAIANARGDPRPEDPKTPAGASARERLELATQGLIGSQVTTATIVWLEYLQATLRWPPILRIGDRVTLFNADFLRALIHQRPEDERVPAELRDPNTSGLPIWLGAYDKHKALSGEPQRGDPRVLIRIELDPQPAPALLLAARETAEFLPAFAALNNDNHDVWLDSESYFMLGVRSSAHAFSFDETKAHDALHRDSTAAHLKENVELLAPHLPLVSAQLRTAARLAVWLRRAKTTDDPTRLLLCERVVEQVCGWAGINAMERFVGQSIKPSWMHQQLRAEISDAYRQLTADLLHAPHRHTSTIETSRTPPQHGPDTYASSINLKAVLDHLDDLVAMAPLGSTSCVRLTQLSERCTDAKAMKAWTAGLEERFDRRNARLRRTRNALMHGGPLTSATVDDVARFAETLAFHALTPAIEMLLAGEDVTDGFLDRRERYRVCVSGLHSGVPVSEALFWKQ